ncbi:MAG: hypothetical protein IH886_00985 [Nitrospinae bacterium]|nr:hypothetical protein [Nitrospinota bacterium]
MGDMYRLKIRIGDREFEVASSDQNYVDEKFQKHFDLICSGKKSGTEAVDRGKIGSGGERPISLREFEKQVSPKSKTEKAAVVAFFLEHFLDPVIEEWKPNDVFDRFSEIRGIKPANPSDTIKKSNFFMPGSRSGFYKLSRSGVAWVEKQISQ